ncbi:MAG: YceI family protein, partial [Chthoniobacterales bacterium]
DGHLKSPDFFDAAKFPTLSFETTSVKQTGPETADVTGKFTMHGVTKEIVLKAHFTGKGAGMNPGEVRAGWEATTTLKRSEFGLTWSKVVEGTQVVGDDVAVNLEIEAVKKP